MKTFFFSIYFSFIFVLVNAQTNNESTEEQPQGKWRVSKEYDNDGNIISYDSIYVWSSGDMKDFNLSETDSVNHFFKGFIRDFEMPDFNFPDTDSLGIGFKDFFGNFEMPDFDNDFNWDSLDSIFQGNIIQRNFPPENYDFQKEIENLKQQVQELKEKLNIQENNEAIEPKKEK